MAARGNTIRERFHPLYHARSLPILRGALEQCDVAAWAPVPGIRWRIRVRLVRHASHFLPSDGVEPTITAFMRAVCEMFESRLCWDVGANFGYYGFLLKSTNFVGIPSRYLDRQRELIERWGRIVGSRASRGGGV
jgi:hypothetical protein